MEQPVLADHPGLVTRRRRVRLWKALAPYLLSLPAGIWLLALFLVPLFVMLSLSLQTCNFGTGACVMTWHWGEFGQQLSLYHTQFLTSIYFAGAATLIDLIISFPIAYWIAFYGGNKKNFFLLMLLHSLFYVPTISITNSIAFANLRDPANEFGPVRVWGTIGWIAASWPFIFILADWSRVPAFGQVGFTEWLEAALGTSLTGDALRAGQRYIFLVAGVASFVLAAISPTLPHTPPKPATGEDALATLKAARLLRLPFVAVLFLVTFIDAAVHQSFFFWTFTFLGPKGDGGVVDIPANWVGTVMKIGQIAEILTMLILGYVLKSFGWRTTMAIGVLGHGIRFAVFAVFVVSSHGA